MSDWLEIPLLSWKQLSLADVDVPQLLTVAEYAASPPQYYNIASPPATQTTEVDVKSCL